MERQPAILEPPEASQAVEDICSRMEAGETVELEVTSPSMQPELCPGDRVKIRAVSARPFRCGDIVVALRAGRLVCTRLLWRSRDGWWTKPDSAETVERLRQRQELIGRVVSVQETTGRVRTFRQWSTMIVAHLFRALLATVRRRREQQLRAQSTGFRQ